MRQTEAERMQAEINTFLNRLADKGIQVSISNENKGKIIQRRHKKGLSRFLNDLGDSLRAIRANTEINNFSILCDEKNSTQVKLISGKPALINLAQITPGTPRYQEVLHRAVREFKKIKKEPEMPKVKEAPRVEPILMTAKSGKFENVFPPELLELDKEIKVYLPGIKGIRGYRDEKSPSPYIELSSEYGELAIWKWRTGESKVIIGKEEYQIEGDELVEVKWDETEPRKFPLRIGEKGEKIIDIGKIEGNEEIDQFLK